MFEVLKFAYEVHTLFFKEYRLEFEVPIQRICVYKPISTTACDPSHQLVLYFMWKRYRSSETSYQRNSAMVSSPELDIFNFTTFSPPLGNSNFFHSPFKMEQIKF